VEDLLVLCEVPSMNQLTLRGCLLKNIHLVV
jgi:hypothetical protein